VRITKRQLRRIIKEAILGEASSHPVEKEDTTVLGKGKLSKGQKMKGPSGLGYGLDYSGSGYTGGDLGESEEDLEEQDEIAGFTGPLGAGSSAQRRKRRRDAYLANAEAFGGAAK
jgi:hypothetical protein